MKTIDVPAEAPAKPRYTHMLLDTDPEENLQMVFRNMTGNPIYKYEVVSVVKVPEGYSVVMRNL